jgi:hypothetical protein
MEESNQSFPIPEVIEASKVWRIEPPVDLITEIQKDVIAQLSDHIEEEIGHRIHEEITSYNFFRSLAREIDYDDLASSMDPEKVSEYIDVNEIADCIDMESEVVKLIDEQIYNYFLNTFDANDVAADLLNEYDPKRACSTGRAFTEAVANAYTHAVSEGMIVPETTKVWTTIEANFDGYIQNLALVRQILELADHINKTDEVLISKIAMQITYGG